MPRERTSRQPAGPGRTVRRPHSPKSAASAVERVEPVEVVPSASGRARLLRTPRLRDLGLTRRALILVGVFAILALSYATPLRTLLNQQRDMATADAAITQRTAQLSDLNAQLQRWKDPAYVKSQARSQLGWVLPGETGYRVIGADGTVVTDEASTQSGAAIVAPADDQRWWDRLVGSIQAADGPAQKR